MATQPQRTLATANAPTTHGVLLASTPPTTTASSSHLAHYTSGRLGYSSSLSGGGGGGGGGDGGVGYERVISGSTRTLPSSTISSSIVAHSHNQPPRPASRRVRPCSLCGTTAVRPQPTYLPTAHAGPLEQPIVLLHRLEDGLPQGDIKSLHARGTIRLRLLPVQSNQGHEASSDYNDSEGGAEEGDDSGDDARAGGGESGMMQTMEGEEEDDNTPTISWNGDCTQSHSSSISSSSDIMREQLDKNDTEVEVDSEFLEENYPIEAIIDSEVTVVTSQSSWGDTLNSEDGGDGVQVHSVKKMVLDYGSDNDSECGNKLDIQIEKVESIKDQNNHGIEKTVLTNDDSPGTHSKVSKNLDVKSELGASESTKVYENENINISSSLSSTISSSASFSSSSSSSSSFQSCSEGKHLRLPIGDQLSDVNHSPISSPKCPSTSIDKQSASFSAIASPVSSPSQSSVSSVTKTCIEPSVAAQTVVDQCTSVTVETAHDSFTPTKCNSSPSLRDLTIPYSPKMRHSPVSWSPSSISQHPSIPPPLGSHPSPAHTVSSPPSSPPSPCESPSLPFSPPPSPALETTQLNMLRTLVRGDSQTQSLSPYSPGSSPPPTTPASPHSPSDSPPSPSASAESSQRSSDIPQPSLVEQNDSTESNLETVDSSHYLLESNDTFTAPPHPLTLSYGSQVDTTINAQDDSSLDINNKSEYTQVKLRENNECNNPLRLSDNMAYDSEMKTKSSLDDCASSIVEPVDVDTETEVTPMKIKFRIRPKLNKSPVHKIQNDECNKNGIPKIVLTLKGSGPNKEYSCSNRLRNEDQSFSNISMTYRKHKAKKDKKQKDKYKVRKSLKGNKHKRHLELFGEDSNDSIELIRDDSHNGLNGQGEDIITVQDKFNDGAESPPVAFPTLDLEPVPDPEDVGGLPSLQARPLLGMKEEASQVQPVQEIRLKKRIKLRRGTLRRGMLVKKRILRGKNNQRKGLAINRLIKKESGGFIKGRHSRHVELKNQSSSNAEVSSEGQTMIKDDDIQKDYDSKQRKSIETSRCIGKEPETHEQGKQVGLKDESSGIEQQQPLSDNQELMEDQTSSDEKISHGEIDRLRSPESVPKCEDNLNDEMGSKPHEEVSSSSSLQSKEEPLRRDTSISTISLPNTRISDTSQDSSIAHKQEETLYNVEPSSPGKSRGSNLRTRLNRATKKPESGRDSDSCLWVSFGVDGPVPLPACHVPSLESFTKAKGSSVNKSEVLCGAETMAKSDVNVSKDKVETVDNSDVTASTNKDKITTNSSAQIDCNKLPGGETDDDVYQKNVESTDTGNLNLNSVDRLVEETAEQLVKEYQKKKEKASKQVIIQANKKAEQWKPVRPQERDPVITKQTKGDPAKDAKVIPSIRLRSSPKRVLNLKGDQLGETQQVANSRESVCVRDSSEVPGENIDKIKSQENSITSSPFPVESPPSRSAKGEDTHENHRLGSKTVQGICTKIMAADLEKEDAQCYRPKKIKKVLNENIPNFAHKESSSDKVLVHDVAAHPKSVCYDKRTSLDNVNQSSANTNLAPEAPEEQNETHVPETPRVESSASRTESEASESDINNDKTNEINVGRDGQQFKSIIPDVPTTASGDREDHEKVKGEQIQKKRNGRRKKQTAELASQEIHPGSPSDRVQAALTKEGSTPCKESTSSPAKGATPVKGEKEIKRKGRKPRRKDESGSDSDSTSHSEVGGKSAVQEIQERLECQHEEERGRRLAQEIKGFNWLEQKIKNSSLSSSSSSALPASSSSKKSAPALLPKSRILARASSLNQPPGLVMSTGSFPPMTKKNEADARRNSYTGCGVSSGLRGHLQTAVPPLVPSSKVTALPKRRLSPPHTLNSPTSGVVTTTVAAPSSNNVALQGNLNISTTMGVVYGPMLSSGTPTYSLSETSTASLFSSPDCDRATLYSSTDSNSATLYGVGNHQLEVLIEDAQSAAAGLLYEDCTNPPNISSNSKPLPVHHLATNSSGLNHPSSLTARSVSRQEGWTSHGKECCKTVVSDSTSIPRVSAGLYTACDVSTVTGVPITDACGEDSAIITVEPNADIANSSASTNPSVSSTEAFEAAGSSSSALDTESISMLQSQSNSSTCLRFSHKHALLKRAFSDMMKSDSEASPEPVLEEDKEPEATDLSLAKSENVKVEPSSSSTVPSKSIKSELSENNEKPLTSESKIAKTKEEEERMFQALPDSMKDKYMEYMAMKDMKFSKSEEDPSSSGKDKEEVGGIASSFLFSVLYELKRTRQEVERLRKQQELMLEKGDRKDDDREEKKEDDPLCVKEIAESPKGFSDKSKKSEDIVESPSDKTAKISIRSDLLATENQIPTANKVAVSSSPTFDRSLEAVRANTKASVIVTDRPLRSPLAKASPLSQNSPVSCRTSPRSSQVSPALSRTSPMANSLVSQESTLMFVNSGSPVVTHPDLSIIHVGLGPPQTSPKASQNSAGISPYSSSGAHGAPRVSPVLPRNSPGVSSPLLPKSSPVLPRTSPAAQSCSPGGIKDSISSEMISDKLRSVYGINNEVEVTPVVMGPRSPLTEPSPQTYLQVVGEQHKTQETPLLLDAVRGRRQDGSSTFSDRERSLSQSSVSFSQQLPYEAVKRPLQSQATDIELKRPRLSMSDHSEYPPGPCELLPPLKPVATPQRRCSINIDTRKAEPPMVRFPQSSIPVLSTSTTEHSTYAQPQSSPTQHHHLAMQNMRRGSESSIDRHREYQQAVSLQHTQYQQHQSSGPSMMRSRGPDKATIFPIPAPSLPSGIRPYMKPITPPTGRPPGIDQHQASILEQPNLAYFQKIKQNVQQSFDALTASERGSSTGQERLQPSTRPYEKARQPQTFNPRVIVSNAAPEAVHHKPHPPPYHNPHYTNCNPHMPNVMNNHPYIRSMHPSSGPSMHHKVSSGLLMGGLQASPNMSTSNSAVRNNSGSSSSDKKRCLCCPQQARFLCSGCKKAWYCSEICQREHWSIHNTNCVL